MKNLLCVLFLMACDCEFEENDYDEVDHSYLKDQAEWPNKLEDPFVESLKN